MNSQSQNTLKDIAKYRDQYTIIHDVLVFTNTLAKKTKIQFNCYLSHKMITKYLLVLLQTGMLQYDDTNGEYGTTDKGRQYILCYEMLNRILGIGKIDS